MTRVAVVGRVDLADHERPVVTIDPDAGSLPLDATAFMAPRHARSHRIFTELQRSDSIEEVIFAEPEDAFTTCTARALTGALHDVTITLRSAAREPTVLRTREDLLDDGSTERASIEAFDRASGEDLRKVKKDNGGLASARNAGLEVARGKLVLPLDADDLIAHLAVAPCPDARPPKATAIDKLSRQAQTWWQGYDRGGDEPGSS